MSFPASCRSLLVWHVHGSWMESFVAGQHRYVIPVNPAKDADGRGLVGRNWPRAQEVSVDELSDADIDLVISAEAGVVSPDVRTLAHALEGFVTDLASATVAGKSARDFAMAHFALDRFLAQWDDVIDECCG
jgi:hypothetical protein